MNHSWKSEVVKGLKPNYIYPNGFQAFPVTLADGKLHLDGFVYERS